MTNSTANIDTTGADTVGVNVKLAALWGTLMLLYIYADFFMLHQPGELQAISVGKLGPYAITQTSLLVASVLMAVPAVMVFLSLVMRPLMCRWANLILGAFYTFVNGSNVIGETWVYYWFFGVVEVAVTLTIIYYAWSWRAR